MFLSSREKKICFKVVNICAVDSVCFGVWSVMCDNEFEIRNKKTYPSNCCD